MGPMRAACRFARELETAGKLDEVERVQVELYGSLALTGLGHGTDRAVLLGLAGNEPASIDPAVIESTVAEIRATKRLKLTGKRSLGFDEARDLEFRRETMFPPEARTQHPNGMRLTAFDGAGNAIEERTFFSIGGGFIVEDGAEKSNVAGGEVELPYPFKSAAELLETARAHELKIHEVMMANECARLRAVDPSANDVELEERVRSGIETIWQTMKGCIERGIATEGILPGGLNVRRRAHRLAERLREKEMEGKAIDPLAPLDWVTVYAMAVNEENAAGGRVVTAPTNGAAGVVPAVAEYFERFVPGSGSRGDFSFLSDFGCDWDSLQGERFDQWSGGWLPGRGGRGVFDGGGWFDCSDGWDQWAGGARGGDRDGA